VNNLIKILKGRVALFFIKTLGFLPFWVLRRIGLFFGYISVALPTPFKTTISKNLQICFPEHSQQESDELTKQICIQSTLLAVELPKTWLASKKQIQKQIKQVNNQEFVDEYVNKNQPLIIATPHIGNWEMFWHWMQINYSVIAMYSKAKLPAIDRLLLDARTKFGGRPLATDPKGIMNLLKLLKQGGVMVILPDQAPKGSGVYTPFFGQSAYTMTLLHKFIQKTQANLLFASCLRTKNLTGFNIDLYKPTFDIFFDDVNQFNLGMNQQLESIILQCPEQYQWSYKRFKRQQDGINLYKEKS